MIDTIIFDMDGVVVDNHHYHFKAWKMFAEKYGYQVNEEEYMAKINGRTMPETLKLVFGEGLTQEEVEEYGEEKEALYREIYAPYQKPVEGLTEFLNHLIEKEIKMGLATSAPPKNVPFTLDNLNVRHYFSSILDQSFVNKGKPDPEIYLKSARNLNAEPENCLVFEDSQSGIKSGLNAGMNVVGLATTQSEEQLRPFVSHIIPDFTGLTMDKIHEWFSR